MKQVIGYRVRHHVVETRIDIRVGSEKDLPWALEQAKKAAWAIGEGAVIKKLVRSDQLTPAEVEALLLIVDDDMMEDKDIEPWEVLHAIGRLTKHGVIGTSAVDCDTIALDEDGGPDGEQQLDVSFELTIGELAKESLAKARAQRAEALDKLSSERSARAPEPVEKVSEPEASPRHHATAGWSDT